MKRLLKKATMTLYHGTCSQRLRDIVASGAILPSNLTGITSNGVEGSDTEYGFVGSRNTEGIYLTNIIKAAEGYANAAVYVDEVTPAFPLVIRVNVDDSKLLPDLDDLGTSFEFTDDTPRWRQSLNYIGQAIYPGKIALEQISGVCFSTSLDDIIGDDALTTEVAKHLHHWYSCEEILAIITDLESQIDN